LHFLFRKRAQPVAVQVWTMSHCPPTRGVPHVETCCLP